MPTHTPTAAPTLPLTLDQAAAELGTFPLAIARLVARRRLSAVRQGPAGPWRVPAAALAAYMEKGSADLAAPFAARAAWFAQPTTQRIEADRFVDRMTAAAREQAWTPARLRQTLAAPSRLQSSSLQVPLTYTPKMDAVCRAEIPAPYANAAPANKTTAALCYLVNAMQTAAKQTLDKKLTAAPLAALYASPEAYAATVAAATAIVAARRLGFATRATVTRGGRTEEAVAEHILAVRDWANPAMLTLAAGLAF